MIRAESLPAPAGADGPDGGFTKQTCVVLNAAARRGADCRPGAHRTAETRPKEGLLAKPRVHPMAAGPVLGEPWAPRPAENHERPHAVGRLRVGVSGLAARDGALASIITSYRTNAEVTSPHSGLQCPHPPTTTDTKDYAVR